MFEKLNQISEQAATNASRRQFLGRLGTGALAAATLVSSLLASEALAKKSSRPPLACGGNSDLYCRGLVEGAYCQIGTMGGICVGSPACNCRPKRRR